MRIATLVGILRRDVVEKALVDGPGVHASLPGIDIGISETKDLGRRIDTMRRDPRRLRRLVGLGGWFANEGLDRFEKSFRRLQRLGVASVGEDDVKPRDLLGGSRGADGCGAR